MTVPLLAALHFPPIEELVHWKPLALKGTPLAVNKTVLLTWLGVILTMALYWAAGRRAKASTDLVPRGAQNIVEATVEFVRNDIILQTIGPTGLGWTAFLVTMFFFIFILNMFEVIPVIQFPVTARMAVPAFLAIVVWLIFNTVGIKSQGFRAYMRSVLIPPGVPKSLLVLVVPIEFVSTILVRPFTLAVRLFANMLAGHLLLVTFAVLSAALFTKSVLVVIIPLPFAMLVLFWAFEAFIALLQAFIFTILTAVYIGGAMHPEH
jgi:F-type H+-transporting ATPase subunit a